MFGLPKEFDASTFVGCELDSVTFASNAIHLSFGAEHSITANLRVSYRLEPTADLVIEVVPLTSSSLPALIGQVVDRADVRRPGDLILHFEGGGSMLILDDDAHYESYSLRSPAGEIFV